MRWFHHGIQPTMHVTTFVTESAATHHERWVSAAAQAARDPSLPVLGLQPPGRQGCVSHALHLVPSALHAARHTVHT